MIDVIKQSRSKELYKLFRGLSGKGMTIVLLAHTNKYKDADGKPIYEGTGDLRSDVDELIYLIPKKNDDGSMTVSTMPDKVRGKFEPITFEITPDREVSLSGEYVDVSAERERAAKREKDSVVIELVTESINKGGFKQKDIVDYCKEHSIGWRTTTAVLKRYKTGNHSGCNELWTKEKAFERNAWNYHLNSESTPP